MSADLNGLFAGLEQESLDRLATRRDAVRSGGRLAAALALSSVPVAIAATAGQAFASVALPSAVVRVLNFALTLEYLEAEFYRRGLQSGVIPGGARRTFEIISGHEDAHVAFLRKTLGSHAVAKPKFDFTAGGAIPNPFRNYEVFLLLAQAFEDTGVRAYKGQAPALKPYDAYLTAALTIHSVEARHAAQVRRLRGLDGWIPTNEPTAPAAVKSTYAGEENLDQLGVNVGQFRGDKAGSAAFDEPLTRAQVLDIAGAFLA